jgi:hypothetical protein
MTQRTKTKQLSGLVEINEALGGGAHKWQLWGPRTRVAL